MSRKTLLLLFGLVLLAWLPLAGMDFWQDDRALVFKLQHPHESAGLFGQTLWGNGPYRGTVAPLYPLWLLFGLNPAPYFAGSIVMYFLATLVIFWLGKKIFERDDLALVMASLFAASHLGADGMLRIVNSYQNLFGVIGAAATIGFLLTHLKTRNIFWYFLALIAFIATLEVVFIRSGGLIVAVIAADLLFAPLALTRSGLKEFGLLIARQLPFAAAFNKIYEATADPQGSITTFVKTVIGERQFEVLLTPLQTFGSLVVPDRLIEFPKALVGGIAVAGLLVLSLIIWKKSNRLARATLFGLVATFALFLPNWIQYPTEAFNTTHRYLSGSLIGYYTIVTAVVALIAPRLAPLARGKQLALVAGVPVVLLLALNLHYQVGLLTNRAQPSKRFYRQLRQLVPRFEKGSLVYFEVATDPVSQQQFRDFFAVGSMPDETAIAIYYGIDRYDITLADSTDELLALAAKGRTATDKLYYFRYSATGGLENQSDQFQKVLAEGQRINLPSITLGKDEPATIRLNNFFNQLSAELTASSKFKTILALPTPPLPPTNDIAIVKPKEEPIAPLAQAARALLAYRSAMKLSASSQWRFNEVVNAADDDPNTTWMAHRIHFHEEKQETLTASFDEPVALGNLWWVNGHSSRTTSRYRIEVSADGSSFKTVVERQGKSAATGELIKESFPAITARAVRLVILETTGGDAPQVAGLYPLPPIEEGIDLGSMLEFLEQPTDRAFIEDLGVRLKIGSQGKLLPKIVMVRPGSNQLKVALPPGFARDNTIEIGPLKVSGGLTLENLTLTIPSLEQLKTSGLLKEFSEN